MQWPILVKLDMWAVQGTSVIYVVCRYQMHILNSSFANLFWLANNNKGKYPEFYMSYSNKTWCKMGGVHSSITHVFCCCRCTYEVLNLPICLIWLITTKSNVKSSIWAKVTKLGMGVVYYTQVLPIYSVVVNAHINYLICMFHQRRSRCIFFEYSKRVSRVTWNFDFICFSKS